MASSIEFVEYVCDQIQDVGAISYRKMFGEYGVYCNGKIIGLICDDCFFVKPTEDGRAVWSDLKSAPPYPGAKPYFVIDDLERRDTLTAFIEATYLALPEPKKRK